MNHPRFICFYRTSCPGYGGRRERITRLVPRTLDSIPPPFPLILRSTWPASAPPARSVADSLTRSDWHGHRGARPPSFVGSIPPAGVIRRTSYSPCAALSGCACSCADRHRAEAVAGHPAPPDIRPPGARGKLSSTSSHRRAARTRRDRKPFGC
jgi:hypothetical protein